MTSDRPLLEVRNLSVTLPKGAENGSHERDLTIATIVAPSSLKSEEGDNETPAGA